MSIPGKQKHHSDIALDLMKIRLIFTVRFRISPFGIKWSIDISNVNSLGRGWKELLMAKETVIYCMGLLFKAHVMQKNGTIHETLKYQMFLGNIRFYREIPTLLSWFNSNHLIGDDGNNSETEKHEYFPGKQKHQSDDIEWNLMIISVIFIC